jgi:alpha-beta hydrolase superfamily lysophospholipase
MAWRALTLALFAFTLSAYAHAGERDVRLDGLGGTYATPDTGDTHKAVVIVAGSGPTDRNGNKRLGVHTNNLEQISDALTAAGIAVLRYDKRGIGASKALVTDEATLRFDDFVEDARRWADWAGSRERVTCVFMLGHSEGGLIATLVAERRALAGLMLVTSPGRTLGGLLREQLSRNLTDAGVRTRALSILDALAGGKTVADVPDSLRNIFRPSVQPYLVSVLDIDPARELAQLDVPTLIVSAGRDLQVDKADFDALKAARPDATAALVPEMNHVLKDVPADRDGNLAAYRNPDLPLSPDFVSAIRGFLAGTPCPN